MPLIDRRERPRVSIELPAYRLSRNGRRVPIGRTANISRNGVLIEWEAPQAVCRVPVLGSSLKIDLDFPPAGYGRKSLRCRGRVVRIVLTHGAPRVALAIDRMDFHDHDQPLAVAPEQDNDLEFCRLVLWPTVDKVGERQR